MRHVFTWLIGISLSCLVIGCGGNPPADQGTSENPSSAPGNATATLPGDSNSASGNTNETVDSSKFVLVSLSVPNMT